MSRQITNVNFVEPSTTGKAGVYRRKQAAYMVNRRTLFHDIWAETSLRVASTSTSFCWPRIHRAIVVCRLKWSCTSNLKHCIASNYCTFGEFIHIWCVPGPEMAEQGSWGICIAQPINSCVRLQGMSRRTRTSTVNSKVSVALHFCQLISTCLQAPYPIYILTNT